MVAGLWWGYVHANGSIQAKPFSSQEDLDEAEASPFVRRVVNPFEAQGREDAIRKIKTQVQGVAV